jgi:hypothetical protein
MKLKPFLIFLVIFVIGFGSGFLVSGRLTKSKIAEVKERQTPAGFKKDLYKYINPDKSQQKYIDSIIAAYVPRIREESIESRNEQKRLRDSMFTMIQGLLDQKQQKKFKKFEAEKIVKPSIKKEFSDKDTTTVQKRKSTQKRNIEEYRNSLPPEQRPRFDSMLIKQRQAMRNPELKKELRVYMRKNIFPVLRKYRVEFENELSEDERALLTELRAIRNSGKFNGGSEDEPDDKKQIDQQLKTELRNLIQNHKVTLEKMAAEIKPQREKWTRDMDEIKKSYYPAYKNTDELKKGGIDRNTLDFLMLDVNGRKMR